MVLYVTLTAGKIKGKGGTKFENVGQQFLSLPLLATMNSVLPGSPGGSHDERIHQFGLPNYPTLSQ